MTAGYLPAGTGSAFVHDSKAGQRPRAGIYNIDPVLEHTSQTRAYLANRYKEDGEQFWQNRDSNRVQ